MQELESPQRRSALAAGLGTLALLTTGCSERGRFFAWGDGGAHSVGGLSMGSTYSLKIATPGLSRTRLQDAEAAVADALQAVVARMSHYEAASELAMVNQAALGRAVPVSSEMRTVLQVAASVREASGGAFDVSLGRPVDAWGFGPSERVRRPLAVEAVQALQMAHPAGGFELDASAGMLTRHADVQINLSGIAKGFGVDRACVALEALGITDYMLEVGGEIRTRGLNGQRQPWQLAVELPDAMPQRALQLVPLSGPSLATSGDYRNFFIHDGRRYCHELDPGTAAPVRHALASVSVVAANCTLADAWSTALFVLGPEQGLALADKLGLAAFFVVRQADGRFDSHPTVAFAALGGRSLA